MKVLITGGAGFIGSHVAQACLDDGHAVWIADDLSTGRLENIPDETTFLSLDIASDAFAEAFNQVQPDAVIHLAAQINVTASVSAPIYDAESNILNTIRLLDLCVSVGTKRIVFASSAAVYGTPKTLPVMESSPCAPLSPYGVSKLSCEEYIKYYARSHDLNYVILRNANVYGPRQIAQGECGVCAVFSEQLLAGITPTLYGNGTPQRDYVYVGDVAQANLAALTRGDKVTLNISSGQGTPTHAIYTHLTKCLKSDLKPHHAALRPGEIESIYLSSEEAMTVLEWKASTDLNKGLQATIASFQK